MLIALIGARSSGKNTIATHLTTHHVFKRCRIKPSREDDEAEDRSELGFRNFDHLLDFSTKHWSDDFVTTDLWPIIELEKFLKRPFFVLVNVDAPIRSRWTRSDRKSSTLESCLINAPRLSLEDFLKEDEIIQYGASDEDGIVEDLRISLSRIGLPATVSKNLPNPTETTGDGNHKFEPSPLKVLEPYATYTILNTETQANLRRSIDSNHLHRLRTSLRPAWDEYFMTLANLASLRSNCMKRRVGAVLITKRDKRVLSTGYNGTPRGMKNCNEGGCARCNGTLGRIQENQASDNVIEDRKLASEVVSKCGVDLNECLCLHAEENALLEAGRDRMGAGEGSTLYCNTCPCLRCSVKIVQCGIKEVVYSLSYSMDVGTAAVFAEAGVQLRQLSLP